jgi:nucleoside-diphosphate-sugar epimerase
MSEFCTAEPWPERRGSYTRAKLEAERLVEAYVAQRGVHAVILRPGQIFGGGIPLLTPAVARRLGKSWWVLGDGEARLPLVYLDDVVDACLLAATSALHRGEVVQLTDVSPTQNEVLARTVNGAHVVHLSESVLLMLGKLSEPLFKLVGKSSPVSAYRLRSAMAKRRFESHNATLLGWKPRVGVHAAIERERPAP